MSKDQVVCNGKTLRQIFFTSADPAYVVPRYQREYAWGREQIERLMTDIWELFNSSPNGKYYLGTLVVKPMQRRCGDWCWEVIDGQQRLTTLSLLMGLTSAEHAGTGKLRPVRFESRKEVNDFLDVFATGADWRTVLGTAQEAPALATLGSAIDLIADFKPALKGGREHDKSVKSGLMGEMFSGKRFMDFVLDNVVLFEVQMPECTDAMEYFEVMNNRGEQLEDHEIVKARLLARLHEQLCGGLAPELDAQERFRKWSYAFDILWTACSKMNGHLIDHLHKSIDLRDDPSLRWTDLDLTAANGDMDESDVPYERQSVIRDFSNFLMHALRLYLRNCQPEVSERPPLDEREGLKWFDKYLQSDKIDPVDFLQTLLRARLDFDRYVVKAKMINDTVVQWRLKEIHRTSDYHYDARNTYGNERDSDGGDIQASLVYLQSALQVSNAVQRYKEWVYEILAADEEVRTDGRKLLALLERFLGRRLKEEKSYWSDNDRNLFVLGLQTPRLLLNAIDYLMWKSGRGKGNAEFAVDDDFVFSYQNSIEHHHPQHDDQTPDSWSCDEIDDIGNLFLEYSSENSSMSNHEPREKKRRYMAAHGGYLPDSPKRRWMYEHTQDDWTLADMQKLSAYVQKLANDFLE